MRRGKLSHHGFIKDTKPEPKIMWGSPQFLADDLGVSERMLRYLITGERKTCKGWRYMTPEEQKKYYQPPKPVKGMHPKNIRLTYKEVANLKFVLYKNWERGTPKPENPEDRVVGTYSEILKVIPFCPTEFNYLVATYLGRDIKRRRHQLNGWRIAQVKKNKTEVQKAKINMPPEVRKSLREYRIKRIEEYVSLYGEPPYE